jgi:hypothetical protein
MAEDVELWISRWRWGVRVELGQPSDAGLDSGKCIVDGNEYQSGPLEDEII